MPRRSADPTRLIASTIEAQLAMWQTLRIRVPALLGGTMSPAEQRRMVGEKIEALVESCGAVNEAAVRMSGNSGHCPNTPTTAFAAWLTLAEAASRPYHRRVKANARRLTKTGRKQGSG